MKGPNPKISFTLGPAPQADVTAPAEEETDTQTDVFVDPPADTVPLHEASGAPQTTYADDDGFDREAWERDLHAPVLDPLEGAKPKPEPKLPPFGTIGFMGQPPAGVLPQNAKMLGMAAAVAGLCLFIGITVVGLVSDDAGPRTQATFSAPAVAPVIESEVATRAAMATINALEVQEAVTPEALGAPHPQQTKPVDALEILGANKLRMLQESILADIYTVERFQRAGVERIRLSTHNAPLKNEETYKLLQDAVARGELEMSKSLLTTARAVDVETLMFNLVQMSLLQEQSDKAVDAAIEMSRRFFAPAPARTQAVNGARYYTVQEGDSLAYIALQFYGKPAAFKRILGANNSILQSPDQIRTGQRLIIPR